MTTTHDLMLYSDEIRALPLRERVGLVINSGSAKNAIQAIIAAEQAGVRQIWTTQGPASLDALTIYTVAATQTATIRLGTSILPTYPRHPLVVAAQARAFQELAPGRLRLGVGSSHRPTIEGMYGLPMTDPLAHLREFVAVLRSALWQGEVDYQGRFYQVKASLPAPCPVPILTAALGKSAFQAAGEFADGALSWVCPLPYLLESALPALQAGARKVQRPTPPLVAHIPVALETDRALMLAAARSRLGYYGKLPFYRSMFAEAGYSLPLDGTLPEDLIDHLVVSGDEQTVAARMADLLASGIDELNILLVPTQDEARQWSQLAHVIGRL